MLQVTIYNALHSFAAYVMQPLIPGIPTWCSAQKPVNFTMESGDWLEVEELSGGEVKLTFKKSVIITLDEFKSSIEGHIVKSEIQ